MNILLLIAISCMLIILATVAAEEFWSQKPCRAVVTRDGAQLDITAAAQLRYVAFMADRVAKTLTAADGSSTTLRELREDIDRAVRRVADPAAILDLLERYNDDLIIDSGYGFYMLQGALLREVAARKAAK